MTRDLLAFALLALLGCRGTDARPWGAALLTPCSVPNVAEQLRCGDLEVPEVRGVTGGRTIRLHVVVVPSLRQPAARDPWVELVGGPGNAATDFARAFVEELQYIRRDRDVLLIDQRGTGGSNPLYCPDLAQHQVSSLPPRFPAAAVELCRERLARTASLAHYASAHAADDLDAVRVWLGYRQLNLFGSSYGTRVALEYLRRYPEHARSAMLWGVVAPDFRRPLPYPRDGQRALDRLIAACAAEVECRKAYPATAADLRSLLARLDMAPVAIALRDPTTGDTIHTAITHEGVAQAIWSALGFPDRARRVPFVIHRAVRGDYKPLLDLDVATGPPRRRYYNGMHLSVVCGEEVLQNSRTQLEDASEGSFMPSDRAIEYLDACGRWGVPVADPAVLAPVVSPVPTLIVSGELDPITPPRWGAQVAQGLARSRHIIVPHLAHESSGLRGAECLDSLFARFLADPNPARLATDCISAMHPPDFTLPPTHR